MLKGLIVLAATTVVTVTTTVIVSNVKKQKEEKGKFEFKGLFEKAAAKQAAKDSICGIKGGIRTYFNSYGWVLLIGLLKSIGFPKNFKIKETLLISGVVTAEFFILSLITTLFRNKGKTLKEKISSYPKVLKEDFFGMIGWCLVLLYFIKDILTILVAYAAIKSRDPLAMFNTGYKFIILQLLMMLMPKMTVTAGEPENSI